ncbi:phosphatidylserine/phosphatidylglycerophosphate/cardiolipin synthase-like enzyme [Krasilnikovia cinnamomea]|uniref:Phosphatidylserine/phosphatidylglycerophosphate/ cardiolipin synthase-like enzyme n=1 Tax=Krasilnikovia cinnamomea TaxID=349313 RepID=A0A4Q7ZTK2_9ACTN|nr:phospholipase D-like domain-containing protein [Krasilnikovia cinnamomea]RZU53869.1 phosphatidylserine/phosphatidylglycerophosphate/cardiolipin synthase-like enzyme [Krasilnikovia cinnamomea]
MRIDDWFLTDRERGNPATSLPAWCAGNRAEPLVHGSAYFARLAEEVAAMSAGDHLFFTDWRGDPDQRLTGAGPTVRELFVAAAERGVIVKGLVWRSHLDTFQYSEDENRHLGEYIEQAGGEVLLDQRVRVGGSHHQKLIVLRHPSDPARDVAFAGGIDLCHSRRDDAEHRGDPQAVRMAEPYGARPPWHDLQLMLRGPVVGALDQCFRERWRDKTTLDARRPLAYLRDRMLGADLQVGELPPRPPDPPPAGPHLVQVLRTYPDKHPPYPFAPDGERSIARAYRKAVRRARSLIYVEDQYLWSREVADLFAAALRENPALHLVVVVPRHADVDGRFALPPNQVGRVEAVRVCRDAAPDRVHVFDVENHAGTPVYVHAKVCVVDDTWSSVGSDNFNRRSWSHDSELSCAVLDTELDPREPTDPGGRGDGARVFARELRLRLMREHLDRADGDDADLIDARQAVEVLGKAADALQAWHDGGRVGERPPGRLRPHRPERLRAGTRMWAMPLYRLVYDPDGRPWRLRRRTSW